MFEWLSTKWNSKPSKNFQFGERVAQTMSKCVADADFFAKVEKIRAQIGMPPTPESDAWVKYMRIEYVTQKQLGLRKELDVHRNSKAVKSKPAFKRAVCI